MKQIIFITMAIVLFISCENKMELNEPKDSVKKELFDGYVQKGPFVSGSSVSIQELDLEFDQTGKSYSTTISNNMGNFEQKNIELISPYVQLKADGYYFNEVTGKTSAGQISLYALADISESNSANINVLTHLERARVEYLLKEGGKTFTEAKQQAQKDVLNIFSLHLPTATVSESLNLIDNALLLAISCILQGSLPVGDLVELMANISADIRADGKLDNPALGSRLVDNAKTLHLSEIRKNLEGKYAETSQAVTIPDFEQYVRQFLENTPYQQTTFISYPAQGAHGDNILSDEITSVISGQAYSMTAGIPTGFQLKVVLKGGIWSYSAQSGPENWRASVYDTSRETQEFVTIESGRSSDLLFTPGQGLLSSDDQKYYTTIECYENQSQTPVFTKKLEILPPNDEPDQPSGITYPAIGKGGINILADGVELVKQTEGVIAEFSASAVLPKGSSLKVVISGKMIGLYSATNWSVVNKSNSQLCQFILTSIESGQSADAAFMSYHEIMVEYYENGATTPTKVKNVYLGGSADEDDAREREMLIAFYKSTNGDKWIRNDNWCSDKPVSLWYGIKTIYHTASSKSHVYSIELPNNNLTGAAYVADFKFLDGLNILNGNKIESLMIDNCGTENQDLNYDYNTVLYHDYNYSQVHLKTLKITNTNGYIYVNGNFSAENVIISDCKLSSKESIIFNEPSTMVGTLTVSNCMMSSFSADNSVIDHIIIDNCTFLEKVDGLGHAMNAYIHVGNKTQISNCKGLLYIYSSRDCSDLTITNTICDDIQCNNP